MSNNFPTRQSSGGNRPLMPPNMMGNNNNTAPGANPNAAAWMNQQLHQQQQQQRLSAQQQMAQMNPMNMNPQQQQRLQMMIRQKQQQKLQQQQQQQQQRGVRAGGNMNPSQGMGQPNQMMQALEEQKRRYSMQLQQRQQMPPNPQQMPQNQQQMTQQQFNQQQPQQSTWNPQQGQQGNVPQQPNTAQGNTNPNMMRQQMPNGQQPPQAQAHQMVNFQVQQQRINQLQNHPQLQHQQLQQLQGQAQNQMLQGHPGQMMHALEEQKRRYSAQLQQLQTQQPPANRPGSASSHQSPQQGYQMTGQMDRRGTGTPLSPSMRPSSARPPSTRPSSARPSSTQPTRPPSRPSSQLSHASHHSIPAPQNAPIFPGLQNTIYNPISTTKSNKSSMSRGGSTASSGQHVAFDMPQTSPSPHLPTQETMASSASTGADQAGGQPKDAKSQKATASSAGKKTPPQRRNSTHNAPSLPYDQVAKLANACTTEEKLVFVSKQILGSGHTNGFQKAMSACQRMKRQRARSFKQKEGGSSAKEDSNAEDEEERLKHDTFNVRLAKRMQSEMKEGLQFCNVMADVIRSIIEDIDPENPVLLVQPPMIGTEADFASMPSSLPSKPPVDSNIGMTVSMSSPGRSSLPKGTSATVPQSPSHARKANPHLNLEAETVADGNPNGSTLRKLRKKGSAPSHAPDHGLLKMVSDHDAQGNKLPKKELSHRLFEANRFRSLDVGDFVAAKVSSQEVWILARVAKQWKAVGTYKQLAALTASKRDALFKEKVYIQDNDDYNGDVDSARPVSRQHVLPLPRSFGEANDWGSRLRKGQRIYAMYPNTTALYCGSVVDSTTYCRKQDDIIVVQFDGDEDDDGAIPERHIPARFVTLIPREFPASHKKRKKSTDGGTKKRSSPTHAPPSSSAPRSGAAKDSSVDEMLLGMYGDSASNVMKSMNDDELNFSTTPGNTPPPGQEAHSRRTKRPIKKQKKVDF